MRLMVNLSHTQGGCMRLVTLLFHGPGRHVCASLLFLFHGPGRLVCASLLLSSWSWEASMRLVTAPLRVLGG